MTLAALIQKGGLRQYATPTGTAPTSDSEKPQSVARVATIAVALINPIKPKIGFDIEKHKVGLGECATAIPATAATDGDIQAVLIESEALGAPIWFALRDGWEPGQGDERAPLFYASELPALRMKTPEQLRSIFNVKSTFGGGLVRQ